MEISRAQSFGVKTFVYQSISEYLDQESKNLGLTLDVKYKHIPIGASAYLSHANDQMENGKSVFAVATENIPLYNLNLYPDLPLSDNFISAVKNIKSNQSCEEFLNLYGTHYQSNLELGGQFAMAGVLQSSDTLEYSNMNVGVSMHIAMISGSFGGTISPYAGINKNTPPVYKGLSKFKYGGDTSISTNYDGWYTDWVTSIPKYPAAVSRQLNSIIPLMKSISVDSAATYEAYILDKLNNLPNTAVQGANPPPILDHYQGTSPPNGGLYLITLYDDDDDGCHTHYWDVESSSGDSQSVMKSRNPLPISWSYNRVFGNTPQGNSNSKSFQSKEGVSEKSFEKKKLVESRNTNIYSADYRCGVYPCIPGLDTMGIGFDIVTGATRLPVIEWTFYNKNIWRSPRTGITYSYPDQISIETTSTSSTSQNIYQSFSEYCINSTDVSSPGWHGLFFQFGSEQQSVMHAFDSTQSIIGLAEESYISHSLTVQSIFPSSKFNQSVANLPNTYDQEVYFQFLSNWGTHYSQHGSYGGKAKLFSYIDQEYYSQNEEYNMETTLGFQFNGWKAGIEWGTSSSTGTYSFSEDSFQWVSFYGGDATLALTSQWNNWTDSTYYAPAQVYKQIIPIQTLVANANISQNIAKAVSDYYSMNQVNLPPPIYLRFSFTSFTSTHSGQVVSYYD